MSCLTPRSMHEASGLVRSRRTFSLQNGRARPYAPVLGRYCLHNETRAAMLRHHDAQATTERGSAMTTSMKACAVRCDYSAADIEVQTTPTNDGDDGTVAVLVDLTVGRA